jgi:hypothetical protein
MKIQPVASPAAIQQAPSNAAQAKARAVAAFINATDSGQTTTQQPAQQVVQNQNAISVEEVGAIQTQVSEEGHLDTTETQEVTQETQTPKTTEETTASREWARLARQEKAMRAKVQQQELALKAREEALKAREEAISSQNDQYKGYIAPDRLKQDALTVLAEAGVPIDEFMQQLVSQTQNPQDPRLMAQINKLQSKLDQIERANEDAKKAQAEQQTQAYQAAVQQIKLDVKHLVSNDPEFETVKAYGAVDDVVELIETTYRDKGILLSNEEAAAKVEKYLINEALKVAKLNKVQQQLQAKQAASQKPATQQTQPKQQQTQPMKTLTNATASTRQLSAKERAILAFKGELKS